MIPLLMPPPAGTNEKLRKLAEELLSRPLPAGAATPTPVLPQVQPEAPRDEFTHAGPPCSPVEI